MKKLIFIDVEPLTPRRIEIFQIDALLARGFQVAYWDISQYFDPGKRLADTLSRPYVQHITSLAELRQALNGEQIDQCLFSCEVPGDRISSLGFFRVMERYGTLRIRIE